MEKVHSKVESKNVHIMQIMQELPTKKPNLPSSQYLLGEGYLYGSVPGMHTPPPEKDLGPDQVYPPLPCGQTDTSENISFPQLRFRGVMIRGKCTQKLYCLALHLRCFKVDAMSGC